ncbi:Late embryogenesis abundant protein [Quillaja saponaria]|uniref:Late embryogenesis abundant protein n=1 Tax=Quillaja saponaria TaxID=32244 RepID=A0AAD7LN53_QUISA|nr:Late embryogenesis abundant protein [Quillaja saponaria]
MAATFVRGAQTMNSMFVKPLARKTFHKKSSSADTIRETMKLESEEVRNMGSTTAGDNDNSVWVPHERTGIYYPKGQEKVMQDVPSGAGKDAGVNWFSYNDI